ncbi:MAG: flagellar basal body P-ring formation chaperone FlgA [Hydrogenimonas sp.]|nr:flagellar basal body P-ring formation chaperone FlgA [Hydrogenimonas sp.]
MLLLYIFVSSLNAAETIELKSRYKVESNLVTLKTLGISDSDTTVIKLRGDRSRWSIPAFKMAAKLKEIGYICKKPKSSMILFELMSQKSFPALEAILRKRYEEMYPTLKIESIKVEPTGSAMQNFTYKPTCSVRVPQKLLKKESGTFTVKCDKRRYYFRYYVDGYIKVYKANHQIKKDKIIAPNAVSVEHIPFKGFYTPPITGEVEGRYIAKLNIATDDVLTQANSRPLPAVLKMSRVKCIYKEGTVTIELDATALKSGDIGDIITLKRDDGKVLRGEVVERGLVELR